MRFHQILQAGFLIRIGLGISVGQLLHGTLALSPRYVLESISTVFLDGKPIDDLDSAIVDEGSTLALSSAMPGLVGASMRRRGFYASFRQSITHEGKTRPVDEKEGMLRVKLFNLLLTDLGPLFLGRGVYLPTSDLEEFFAAQPDRFFDGMQQATLNGKPIPPSSLKKVGTAAKRHWTDLKVCALP